MEPRLCAAILAIVSPNPPHCLQAFQSVSRRAFAIAAGDGFERIRDGFLARAFGADPTKEAADLRYSFDVLSKGLTYEVGVDAQTGIVLENGREGAHPD
jgi:hypothetical protein